MDVTPDLSSVTAMSEEAASELKAAYLEARAFLEFYEWVSRIEASYVGASIENIVSIFLFQISPAKAGVDDWVWVIVGDLPPAYITCEDARTPYEALDGYIGAMEEWVEAARKTASVAKLIPVNVPATPENAERLAPRLKFLDEKILPLLPR